MEEYSQAKTIKEVAKLLNISTQMVYKLIRRGEMEVMNEKADQSPQPHPLILEDVSVRKGDFVLGPISIEIPPRAVVGIAGGSGCGKTSLLRGINGLETLESGSVSLGPVKLSDMSVDTRRIGFVFQDSILLPRMNVEENLTFPLKIKKIGKPGRTQRLNEVIDELDLDRSYLEKYEQQLPAGIRQLTAIGKERMHMLDLLLMDEPMRHLDAHLRSEIRTLVRSVVRTLGKTTLLALNEPEDIMAICDYVMILREGKMVEYGPVQQVYSNPQDIASLEALSHLGVNSLTVEVRDGRTTLFDLPAENLPKGLYQLCFRPQDVRIGQIGDIEVEEIQRSVYDSSRDLVTVRLLDSLRDESADRADLVLPRSAIEVSYIRIERYFLYPAA